MGNNLSCSVIVIVAIALVLFFATALCTFNNHPEVSSDDRDPEEESE